MCYKAKCSTCGKTGWGGCGNHLPSVYKSIPEGQHCLCRGWPGVNLNAQTGVNLNAQTGVNLKTQTTASGADADPQPSSSCTTL